MATFDYKFKKGTLHYDEESGTHVRYEDDVVLEEGTYELEEETQSEMDHFVVNLANDHGLLRSISDWTYNPNTERFRFLFSLDKGQTIDAHYLYIYFHRSFFKRPKMNYTGAGYDSDE